MIKRHSLVCVLPIEEEKPAVPGDIYYEDAGWWTCWPLGRVEAPDTFVHLHDEGGNTFTILGSPEMLALIERVAEKSWPGIEALRDDETKAATDVKAIWTDTRPDVLDAEGKPTGKKTGERVVLRAQMAGWNDDGEKGSPDV